jgi:hypothetical protein
VTQQNNVVPPATPTKTATPVTTSDGEMSSPVKHKKCKLNKSGKKHKKKSKHHHCKHKHKKHRQDHHDEDPDHGDDEDDLRIKLVSTT